MSEIFSNNLEEIEVVPTLEDIQQLLAEFVEGNQFEETQRRIDSEGHLMLLRYKVTTDDGYTEYEYTRKGHSQGTQPGEAVRAIETIMITKTFFDKKGWPISGKTLADLKSTVFLTKSISYM